MKKIKILFGIMLSVTFIVKSQNAIKISTSTNALKWTGSNMFKYNKHYETLVFLGDQKVESNCISLVGPYQINLSKSNNKNVELTQVLIWNLKIKEPTNMLQSSLTKIEFIEFRATSANSIYVKANLTINNIASPIEFMLNLDSNTKKQIFFSKIHINKSTYNIIDITSDPIEFEVIVHSKLDNC
ncbi:hypothetical protein [uncultured Algibacter sp.]|uniref:hypothetical protein n=1 Tax=uncultured Algibacter sp. TaxID=298659 RepID=UPI00262749F7|nr:hypothetical protein [uncultured Algibacter sp.]